MWQRLRQIIFRVIALQPHHSRTDVEDAFAQAILEWWQRFRSLRSREMDRWILRRTILRLRDLHRSRMAAVDFCEDIVDFGPTEHLVEQREVIERLRVVVNTRNDEEMLYRWACGWTSAEVARETGVSPTTIRKKVQRLLVRVRREIAEKMPAGCHTFGTSNVNIMGEQKEAHHGRKEGRKEGRSKDRSDQPSFSSAIIQFADGESIAHSPWRIGARPWVARCGWFHGAWA